MAKLPAFSNMSKLALVFDEKHLAQLKCALALNIADHEHDLFNALRNIETVPDEEEDKYEDGYEDGYKDGCWEEHDPAQDRSFQYGDIVGAKRCRNRAALDLNEMYIVVAYECRAVGHTQIDVVPFSLCTSAASAKANKIQVDVAYLNLLIAAEDRALFTIEEQCEDGKASCNVLAPDGTVAATFHDIPGLETMAWEFAERFCNERNEACLLEENEDYELIFPTKAELKQLKYNPTYE